MPYVILHPTVSSYQYDNCIFQQEINYSPLPLYYKQNDYSYSFADLVINISSGSINLSLLTLKRVILKLPICTFSPHNRYFDNELIITAYCKTSANELYPISRVSQSISPASFSHDRLLLDITFLLQQWDQKLYPVYELTFSILKPNLYVEILNDNRVFTTIHIEYEDHPLPSPEPDQSASPLLHLMETQCTQFLVSPQEPFIFDPPLPELAVDITYSTDTGHFTFNTPGNYYMHWVLNLRGSGNIARVSVGLLNVSTGDITAFTCPCVMPGQVYGQEVVHITNVPCSYALINNSEDFLQLCDMSTQSSLVIFKI